MTAVFRATQLLAFTLGGVVYAEEPAAKLPKEGVWIRYHASTKPANEPASSATLTLRSLKKTLTK